jgi:hypothetical protein
VWFSGAVCALRLRRCSQVRVRVSIGGKGRWRWCGAVLAMVAVRCALRVGLALDAFESGVDQHH